MNHNCAYRLWQRFLTCRILQSYKSYNETTFLTKISGEISKELCIEESGQKPSSHFKLDFFCFFLFFDIVGGGRIWTLDVSVGKPRSASWAARLLALFLIIMFNNIQFEHLVTLYYWTVTFSLFQELKLLSTSQLYTIQELFS